MLLTCPACSASYRVSPGSLGVGRTVRCARCRVEWFAEGSEPPTAALDPNDDPVIVIEGDVIDAFEGRGEPPLDAERDASSAATAPERSGPRKAGLFRRGTAPSTSGSVRPRRAAAPRGVVAQSPARRLFAKVRPIAVVAAVACAALASALVARDDLVRRAPSLASLFAVVGLPVNVRGLEIADVRSVEEIDDGVPILLVTGSIANVAKAAVDVPRLRLAVKSRDDRELYSWTTVLGRASLNPGESASFRARLASPPAEGQAIDVRFLTRHDLQTHLR